MDAREAHLQKKKEEAKKAMLRRVSSVGSMRGSMRSQKDEGEGGGSKKVVRRTSSVGSMSSITGSPVKPKLPSKWSELRQGAFGPNYSVDEVKHFYSCFSFVDKDMSGEIDVDEWQQFLTGMDQQMSQTDARRLFMHIDANHNGVIDMSEICKVVFNRATPEQLKIMIHVMSCQTGFKKRQQQHKKEFSRSDLRDLFKLYDENNELRLPVKKLKTALNILNIGEKVVETIFKDAGIDLATGDVDAEEFVDLFHGYLKTLMAPA
jgi:Ca2+-binding EF-hand superfamily protein